MRVSSRVRDFGIQVAPRRPLAVGHAEVDAGMTPRHALQDSGRLVGRKTLEAVVDEDLEVVISALREFQPGAGGVQI